MKNFILFEYTLVNFNPRSGRRIHMFYLSPFKEFFNVLQRRVKDFAEQSSDYLSNGIDKIFEQTLKTHY